MSSAEISAGRAFVSLYVKTSEFAHGLVNAELRLKSFAGAVNTLGELMAAISPANIIHKLTDAISSMGYALSRSLASVGDGLLSLGKKGAIFGAGMTAALLAATAAFGHYGDQLWVMSQRTGASTQLLSELGYAARQTGASAEDAETGIRAMQRTIGDAATGSVEANDSLGRLGLSINDLLGKSPDEQFELIADGVAGIEDPTLAAAAALDVLGRGGAALVPAMRNLREFRHEAQLLGLSVTPQQARLAEQLVDKFQGLKEAAFAGIFKAMEALAPTILDAIKAATDLAVRFNSWIANNQETVVLIGKIAVGLIGASVAVMGMGVGLKVAGGLVGILTGAFSILGHAVAALLPFVTLFSLFGGPIMAAASALFTAVSGAGLLATAFSAIGAVASFVLPHIALILGVIAGVVVGVTALIAGAVVGAAVAAYAFWKLADPFTALKPVAMAAFDAIKNIGAAFSAGGIQGAANAAIEGLKQVFLRGTMAIIEMVQNAMTRLPGFINEVFTGISSTTSGVVGTIRRLFTEMWPAIQASFAAFYSFAQDVFEQLPALAGYAAGRMLRAFASGFVTFTTWLGNTMIGITTALLKAFVSLGPKLIKAMLTGNIEGAIRDIGMAFAAAGGLWAGVANGEMPAFKLSADTTAAMERVSEQFSRAGAGIVGPAGSESGKPMSGARNPGFSAVVGAFEIEKPEIDSTQLEKYTERLYDLRDALENERITSDEFMQGLRDLKRETLGIDPSPLEQFYERLEILNQAQQDSVITSAEWGDQFSKLKRDILGLKTEPIEEYHKKLELLYTLLGQGKITKAEFDAAALEALPDKAKQIFDETRTPLEKYKAELSELEKLQGVLDPDTFDRKKQMLKKGYEDATQKKDEEVKATGPTAFVSYSATAAMSFGSGGSAQDRLLKEAQEQKKIAKESLDEQRLTRVALDKLANGLKHRR